MTGLTSIFEEEYPDHVPMSLSTLWDFPALLASAARTSYTLLKDFSKDWN